MAFCGVSAKLGFIVIVLLKTEYESVGQQLGKEDTFNAFALKLFG